MRVLRSKYLQQKQQQGHIKTTSTTTVTALKVQPQLAAECDDSTTKNDSSAAITTFADVQIESSTTTHCTNQVTGRMLPITVRRNSHYVHAREAFKIQLESPRLIKERRKTIAHCSNLSTLTLQTVSEHGRQIKINLLNVQQTNIRQVKLVFDYSTPSLNWYNDFYKSYENDLWKRIPRLMPTKSSKWQYKCYFCQKVLSGFTAIKAHLNIHMGWKPHHCAECTIKYPSRNSLLKHHHKTTHEMKIPLKMQIKKKTC